MKILFYLFLQSHLRYISQINAQFTEGDSLSSKNLFLIIKNDGAIHWRNHF